MKCLALEIGVRRVAGRAPSGRGGAFVMKSDLSAFDPKPQFFLPVYPFRADITAQPQSPQFFCGKRIPTWKAKGGAVLAQEVPPMK